MKFPALAPRSFSEVGPKLLYLILSLFILTFYFLLFTSSTASASATFDVAQAQNPYLNPNTNLDVPKNQHVWVQTVMIDVMSAMACQLTGTDPTDPKGKCLGVDPVTGNIGFVEAGGGAIGMTGEMIGMLYTPPAHTGDYFRYLANNFGIAKPTHAQTTTGGFTGLLPIQSLWIGFRDIVYLLFVIIFIVIGIAIMLRVRIDPRTVMTIQNQIPKIIIGILLLTFSFAIAGFLIDLMYVTIFLSYELISSTTIPNLLDDLNPLTLQNATPFTAAQNMSSFGIFGIAGNVGASIFFIVNAIIAGPLIDLLTPPQSTTPIIGSIVNWINSTIAGIIGYGVSGVFGGVASALAFLIIAIAILISLIRLWFALIMAYVSILLNVVFAPFWIAASLLPGSPIGFTAWLRSIIANLAAFPAAIIMFLLARVFIAGFGENPSATDFVPPLIGEFVGTDRLGPIIALGIILMLPNVVNMVRAALKAPSLPAAGILAGFAAGSRVVGGTARGIVGTEMASREWIAGEHGFEQRRRGRAFLGRLFGR